jgi:hypothetical protein
MLEIDNDGLKRILNGHMDLMDMQATINTYDKPVEDTLDLIFEAEDFEYILKEALKRNKKFLSNQKKLLKNDFAIYYHNGVLNFLISGQSCTNTVLKSGIVKELDLGKAIGEKLNKMVKNNNNNKGNI